jgi:hypothetical protein
MNIFYCTWERSMVFERQQRLPCFAYTKTELVSITLTVSLCNYLHHNNSLKNKQTNSVVLSPQADDTDWATATCRRNLVPTFVDRGVSCGQRGESIRSLISVFYTGAATFLSSSSLFILTRAEWTPFQSHCYSKNLVAPGMEPRTSGLAARNSDY